MKADSSTDGSLELLLDTICNMFGGITLVAILLAILSSVAPKNKKNQEEQNPTTQDTVQTERLAMLKSLEVEVERRRQQSISAADIDLEQVRKTLAEAKTQVSDADSRQAQLIMQLTTATNQMARLENSIHQLDEELSKARASLDKPFSVNENRVMRLPRSRRETHRSPVFGAVKNKKYYEVSDLSSSVSGRRKYSTKSVDISEEPGGLTIIEMKAHAGVPVGSDFQTSILANTIKRHVNKDREFLDLAVYPDSYREAVILIAFLVESGYRYSWAPFAPDAPMQLVPADELNVQ